MDRSMSELENELHVQMHRLKRLKPVDAMMPDGLSSSEGFALKIICKSAEEDRVARPGMLASFMHVTKSACSQVIGSLEEKGLIERERAKDDFRAVLLVPTEAGMSVSQEMDELREQHASSVMERFGQENLEQLVGLMQKLITCMEEQREEMSRDAARS